MGLRRQPEEIYAVDAASDPETDNENDSEPDQPHEHLV